MKRRFAIWALGAVITTAGAGCTREGGPFASGPSVPAPVPDAGVPIAVMSGVPPTCTPAAASEVLPPRSTLVGNGDAVDSAPTQATYFTADLYGLFKSVCGGCHVESNLGGFVVSQATFPIMVTRDVYNVIVSPDRAVFMPPDGAGGMPLSQRDPSDPVAQLAMLLDVWLSKGSPPDAFVLPNQAASASAGYAMNTTLAAQLTNIGSCVPNKPMVGSSTSAMDQLDAMFAAATTLPPTLDQTDLNTLDSATLAQNGVISYAPAYPLWSDNAKKMRYVRVPRGQSVQFDKAKQTFSIPPNTRFYKTFLKQVLDQTGKIAYRKIETRVIVARPDTTMPDGTAVQNGLFGTYVWNDDESQATLLNDPLRNGKPFADRLFTYVTDEKKAAQIAATNPSNLKSALDKAGVTRHYALPGSERCVQCHMGSPTTDFVLGFTPLQVQRRRTAEGGTYEPTVGDELTQLQRLIDYGVITGISSPADVLPLEKSEGSRAPRNQQELAAQAYMVGNCAHCHNARGFPSVRQPALKDVLVFLPGAGPNQGIFQFKLDTVSPIRKRGLLQTDPIPYITPSLYDFPSDDAIPKFFCPDQPNGSCEGAGVTVQNILAPWRSLIYRNTDTPYDYFDDYTPFPHMPMNTSGYDCRVAKLMGDWMVSIPARIKHPELVQSALPVDGVWPANANTDIQPYEESSPGDSDYAAAVGAAQARLTAYHNSARYAFCPSYYTSDIVDPLVQAEADANQPVTSDVYPVPSAANPNLLVMPALTPIRPNYVTYDDTDPPGDWFPRRPDWETALINPDIDALIADEITNDHLLPDAAEDLRYVLEGLLSIKLDDATRTTLTTPVPFGLWDTTMSGCDFSGVPTAGSFTGPDRPQWMAATEPPPTAPVLVETPGAAVFTTICYNCHGIQADSKGLLSDAIVNMTGGSARVANLRDGLFGPLDAPGLNRERVYGPDAAKLGGGLTADDLAARYLAWMALGGTKKHLPQDILTEVSLAPVVGLVRQHTALQGSPDMLKLGLTLCQQIAGVVPGGGVTYDLRDLVSLGRMGWSKNTGLVDSNGDAELWVKLCSLNNRPIVRVPNVASWKTVQGGGNLYIYPDDLYWGQGPNGEDWYDASGPAPILNDRGNVDPRLLPTNAVPICIQEPTDPSEDAAAKALLNSPALKVNGNVIPFCPPGFVTPAHALAYEGEVGNRDYVDGRKWAARGAINAALAVFLYLDQIEHDPSKRQPLYTQCNLLKRSN